MDICYSLQIFLSEAHTCFTVTRSCLWLQQNLKNSKNVNTFVKQFLAGKCFLACHIGNKLLHTVQAKKNNISVMNMLLYINFSLLYFSLIRLSMSEVFQVDDNVACIISWPDTASINRNTVGVVWGESRGRENDSFLLHNPWSIRNLMYL